MMKFTLAWFRQRLADVWWVLRHDSTAFTEAASGLCLLTLRAILLIVAPHGVLPIDVQYRLYPLTENTWAFYLLILGILQVIFAPSGRIRGGNRHTTIRMWVKILILLGFVTVATAYWLEGLVYTGGMVSFVGLTAFYFVLFLRIRREQASPPAARRKGDRESHAHAH